MTAHACEHRSSSRDERCSRSERDGNFFRMRKTSSSRRLSDSAQPSGYRLTTPSSMLALLGSAAADALLEELDILEAPRCYANGFSRCCAARLNSSTIALIELGPGANL